jgi:DNA ligase-1
VQLSQLVETSRRVAATRSRLEKVALLADLIRLLPPRLVGVGVAYLTGELPQGRLGIGYAVLHELRATPTAPNVDAATEPLQLADVDRTFAAIKDTSGAGSVERRAGLLRALLSRATAAEQDLVLRLIIGEVRHGALEGVVADAVARAFSVEAAAVRRAMMLAGTLPAVAVALAHAGPGNGAGALGQFQLQLFQSVQPMLADTALDADAALERLGQAAFEYKLDGARVQVHKDGGTVEVFSRQQNRVTVAVPEIVERVAALPARRLVLDGEAIALSSNGRPLPFQTTMRRFGRRLDVPRLRAELPLAVSFFDVLRIDDDTLIDRPLSDRWQALAAADPDGALLVPRLVTGDGDAADAFFARAIADGHEGVMAKGLQSLYSAGRRGQEWLKIKSAHTLDLVVLAAEWGSGRRQGWLSNLHLGARDPENGGFLMLGKTFKGMTDQILRWQTEAFLSREIGRDGMAVYVRPELVVEIAFNDVQVSPQYPGGVALRFARLKRYRDDKTAADANTIADVRALLPSG